MQVKCWGCFIYGIVQVVNPFLIYIILYTGYSTENQFFRFEYTTFHYWVYMLYTTYSMHLSELYRKFKNWYRWNIHSSFKYSADSEKTIMIHVCL